MHARLRNVSFDKLVTDILIIWLYATTPKDALEYFQNSGATGAKVLSKPQENTLGQEIDYRLPNFPRDRPKGYLKSLGYVAPRPLTEAIRWLKWSVEHDRKMPDTR